MRGPAEPLGESRRGAVKAPREATIDAQELALAAADILDEKQARDIRILDVSAISTVTDFCVVATGTSSPHVKALISEVQHRLKEVGIASYRRSGTPESGWVVLDYVDAVIHIFAPEARAYYEIERLWEAARPVTPRGQ